MSEMKEILDKIIEADLENASSSFIKEFLKFHHTLWHKVFDISSTQDVTINKANCLVVDIFNIMSWTISAINANKNKFSSLEFQTFITTVLLASSNCMICITYILNALVVLKKSSNSRPVQLQSSSPAFSTKFFWKVSNVALAADKHISPDSNSVISFPHVQNIIECIETVSSEQENLVLTLLSEEKSSIVSGTRIERDFVSEEQEAADSTVNVKAPVAKDTLEYPDASQAKLCPKEETLHNWFEDAVQIFAADRHSADSSAKQRFYHSKILKFTQSLESEKARKEIYVRKSEEIAIEKSVNIEADNVEDISLKKEENMTVETKMFTVELAAEKKEMPAEKEELTDMKTEEVTDMKTEEVAVEKEEVAVETEEMTAEKEEVTDMKTEEVTDMKTEEVTVEEVTVEKEEVAVEKEEMTAEMKEVTVETEELTVVEVIVDDVEGMEVDAENTEVSVRNELERRYELRIEGHSRKRRRLIIGCKDFKDASVLSPLYETESESSESLSSTNDFLPRKPPGSSEDTSKDSGMYEHLNRDLDSSSNSSQLRRKRYRSNGNASEQSCIFVIKESDDIEYIISSVPPKSKENTADGPPEVLLLLSILNSSQNLVNLIKFDHYNEIRDVFQLLHTYLKALKSAAFTQNKFNSQFMKFSTVLEELKIFGTNNTASGFGNFAILRNDDEPSSDGDDPPDGGNNESPDSGNDEPPADSPPDGGNDDTPSNNSSVENIKPPTDASADGGNDKSSANKSIKNIEPPAAESPDDGDKSPANKSTTGMENIEPHCAASSADGNDEPTTNKSSLASNESPAKGSPRNEPPVEENEPSADAAPDGVNDEPPANEPTVKESEQPADATPVGANDEPPDKEPPVKESEQPADALSVGGNDEPPAKETAGEEINEPSINEPPVGENYEQPQEDEVQLVEHGEGPPADEPHDEGNHEVPAEDSNEGNDKEIPPAADAPLVGGNGGDEPSVNEPPVGGNDEQPQADEMPLNEHGEGPPEDEPHDEGNHEMPAEDSNEGNDEEMPADDPDDGNDEEMSDDDPNINEAVELPNGDGESPAEMDEGSPGNVPPQNGGYGFPGDPPEDVGHAFIHDDPALEGLPQHPVIGPIALMSPDLPDEGLQVDAPQDPDIAPLEISPQNIDDGPNADLHQHIDAPPQNLDGDPQLIMPQQINIPPNGVIPPQIDIPPNGIIPPQIDIPQHVILPPQIDIPPHADPMGISPHNLGGGGLPEAAPHNQGGGLLAIAPHNQGGGLLAIAPQNHDNDHQEAPQNHNIHQAVAPHNHGGNILVPEE